MSIHKNDIYQYFIRAKKDFQSKKHPVIGDNEHPSLWLLSEVIPHSVKKSIQREVYYYSGYEILLGKDDNNEECFYMTVCVIQEGGFGQVKYINGYFQLNHNTQEAEWKENALAIKCIQFSEYSTVETIQNEWNLFSTYSKKAKENDLVSPQVRPLFYSYDKNRQIFAFMVMDYLGKDLQTWTVRKYPNYDPFSLAITVLKLIQFLHKNGIVHRDLKLPNFTIKKNKLCVIDFGMAGDFSEDKTLKLIGGTPAYKDPHYLNYGRVIGRNLPLSTAEDVGSVFFLLQEITGITFYPFSYEENYPVYRQGRILFPLTDERAIPENISSECIMETLLLLYDIGENYIPLEEIISRLTSIQEKATTLEEETVVEPVMVSPSFFDLTQSEEEFIVGLSEKLLLVETKNDFAKVLISSLEHLKTLQLDDRELYKMLKRADIIVGFIISTEQFLLFCNYSGYLYYRHIRAYILAEKYCLQHSQQNLQELFRYPVLKNVYLREKISDVFQHHQHHIKFLISLENSLNQNDVNNYDEINKLLIHIKNITSNGSLLRVYNSLSLLENLFCNYMTNHSHGELSQAEHMPTLNSHQEELHSQQDTHPALYEIFYYIISLFMTNIERLQENPDKKMEAPLIIDDMGKFNSLSEQQREDLAHSIQDLFVHIAKIHQKEHPSTPSSSSASSSSYSMAELQKHRFNADRKGKKPQESVENVQRSDSLGITSRLRRFFS